MLDAGQHIEQLLRGVPGTRSVFAERVADGRREGRFRPINPLVVQISIVAPLMFFAASAPFRHRVARLLPAPVPAPDLADMIAHVQAATLAVLAPPAISRRPER